MTYHQINSPEQALEIACRLYISAPENTPPEQLTELQTMVDSIASTMTKSTVHSIKNKVEFGTLSANGITALIIFLDSAKYLTNMEWESRGGHPYPLTDDVDGIGEYFLDMDYLIDPFQVWELAWRLWQVCPGDQSVREENAIWHSRFSTVLVNFLDKLQKHYELEPLCPKEQPTYGEINHYFSEISKLWWADGGDWDDPYQFGGGWEPSMLVEMKSDSDIELMYRLITATGRGES